VIGRLALLVCVASALWAQTGDQVLRVANRRDPRSLEVAEYYRPRRSIPAKNVCFLETTSQEEISWEVYQSEIEKPIARCVEKAGLREKVLYIALAIGVPLKIDGSAFAVEYSSVDSELALLYGKLHGMSFRRAGSVPNPFFGKRSEPFRHSRFPIYLVARLAAFDVAETKAMIDRSLAGTTVASSFWI
jgi:uncharacterized protein (TIGR03790 family)